ncbi:hypothetical protein SK128_014454 [Halocaridina rubra]|uniref:Uncharacterized protein n=1 Tax=Halocaridina rubra TaxID=373956 RepID=A0AAN8ZVC8_HALRR
MAITKEDYHEHGGDRIRHHKRGNNYWASLTPVAPESAPGSAPGSAAPSKETTPAPETTGFVSEAVLADMTEGSSN